MSSAVTTSLFLHAPKTVSPTAERGSFRVNSEYTGLACQAPPKSHGLT